MSNTIKIKKSNSPGAVPSGLEHGELAINYLDGKLFYKNNSNQISEFVGPSGPSGSSGPSGPTGPSGFVAQASAPADTSLLWLDTDEPSTPGPTGPTGPEGGTSTLTTKGDILTRSSSAVARLGVGTNEYPLVADSAQTVGLKYAQLTSTGIADGAVTSTKIDTLTSVVTKTADYTLALGDQNKTFLCDKSSGTITITVPKNSAAAFSIGTQINIIQIGTIQVTISPVDGDVTLRYTTTLKSRSQYSTVSLLKIGTNEWVVLGDLAVL